MAVQTNLFPDPPEDTAAPPAASRRPGGETEPLPVWMQRLSLFIQVLFCIYVGVAMAVMPWWTGLWDHNVLLQSYPRVWAVLRLGFVRGMISGLGLLDIWIGVQEAVHYRDER